MVISYEEEEIMRDIDYTILFDWDRKDYTIFSKEELRLMAKYLNKRNNTNAYYDKHLNAKYIVDNYIVESCKDRLENTEVDCVELWKYLYDNY